MDESHDYIHAPLKHGSARPRDNSAAKEFHTNTEFPLTSQQRSFNNAMSAAPPRGGSKRKQAKENMPARMFTEEEDAEMASEILSPRPPPDDIAPSDLALFVAGGSKSAKSSKRPSIASTQVMMENTEVLFTKKDKAPSSNADVKWKRLFCCAGPLNKEKQNDRQQAGEEVDPNEVIAVKVEEENLLRTVKKHHSQIGRSLLPGYDSRQGTKKCFLIDLDETLVHSSFVPSQKYDFKLNIEIEGKFHQIFVLKRPFVDVFLDTIGPLFECVLFTASLSKYADPVTDFIDPKRFFQHRLFREHCVFFHGNYVKDLSLLGRDVDQCVILDNSPVSYLFHHTHAVHIISWFDNMNDTALLDLIPFFERLSQAPDVPNFLSNNAPPVSASGSNVFSSESGSGATLQRPLSYLHALRSKSRRDSNIITQTKPEQ